MCGENERKTDKGKQIDEALCVCVLVFLLVGVLVAMRYVVDRQRGDNSVMIPGGTKLRGECLVDDFQFYLMTILVLPSLI